MASAYCAMQMVACKWAWLSVSQPASIINKCNVIAEHLVITTNSSCNLQGIVILYALAIIVANKEQYFEMTCLAGYVANL